MYCYDPVPSASSHLIYDVYIARGLIQMRVDFHIEVAFCLEVRNQVALAFIHEFLVDRVFIVNWDQPLLCALGYPGSRNFNGNQGSRLDLEGDVGPVRLRLIDG